MVAAIKVIGQGFEPMTAAALRTGLATPACAPLLLLTPAARRPPDRQAALWFLLLAMFGFVAFNLFYFAGLQRTTATHGALIWGSNPVATMALAALLLRERVTPWMALGILVSTAGMATIVLSSARPASAHGATVAGDLLLVGQTMSWVGFTLAARVVMRRYAPLSVSGYSCVIAFALLAPVAVLIGFRPEDLAAGLAVVGGAGLFRDRLRGAGLCPVETGRCCAGLTRSAAVSNLTPLWGVLLAWAIEGEQLAPVHALAGALIVGGVLLATLAGSGWRIRAWRRRRGGRLTVRARRPK
ncbi:MAG: DMT family transporter [Dehalococcoidia bacterium]